jgi:hypothetical protein
MCNILVGKNEGKKLVGKARCRWKADTETDLKEIGCEVGNIFNYCKKISLRYFEITVMNFISGKKFPE